jgi:hypothetical protein
MRLAARELRHLHMVLSSDIDTCANVLEGDMTNERVLIIASRMEENRRMLEMIDGELLVYPEKD